MKILKSILLLSILSGCGIPQKDYDKVVDERDSLKLELDSWQAKSKEHLDNYLQVERELQVYKEKERKENEVPYITETKALEYLKHDYSFNRRDYVYKDVRIVRLAKNKFKISLMEKSRTAPERNNDFFYNNSKLILTVYKGDKYTLKGGFM